MDNFRLTIRNEKGELESFDKGIRDFYGFLYVEKAGKCGVLSVNNKHICECKYDSISFFENGYFIVALNNKKGTINSKGELVCPIIYDDVRVFKKQGFVRVSLNNKMGLVNDKGEEVCAPVYDDIGEFFIRGIVSVKKNKKWGAINEEGKVVAEPIYDYVGYACDDFLRVCIGRKNGAINFKGNYIIPVEFDEISVYEHEGIALVKLNGKWSAISFDGNCIWPSAYENPQELEAKLNLHKCSLDWFD